MFSLQRRTLGVCDTPSFCEICVKVGPETFMERNKSAQLKFERLYKSRSQNIARPCYRTTKVSKYELAFPFVRIHDMQSESPTSAVRCLILSYKVGNSSYCTKISSTIMKATSTFTQYHPILMLFGRDYYQC